MGKKIEREIERNLRSYKWEPEIDEEDDLSIYNEEERRRELDEDGITGWEEAFMEGWMGA
ncbi:hypothetical protein HYV81_03035 [Candidatus Woesearchaeota archaeon]|nr:hypothetical protein [Candidatus Woesearchaeota archaeon]